MKRTILVLMLIGTLAGCQHRYRPIRLVDQFYPYQGGQVFEPPSAGNPIVIETKDYSRRIDVYFKDSTTAEEFDYSLLVGPHSTVELRVGGVVYVRSGWVYLTGTWPWVCSERVSAHAEGSEMVFEVDSVAGSRNQRRVFFVGGYEARVKVEDTTGGIVAKTWFDVNTFQQIDLTSSTPVPNDTAVTGASKNFLDAALARARAAGIYR